MKTYLPLIGLVFGAACAQADTIVIDGQRHDNVIVRESAAMFYVQDPSTGTVSSVAKDKVRTGDFVRTVDAAERTQLEAAWKAARAKVQPTKRLIEAPTASAPAASAERESDRATPQISGRSLGRVPYLRLRDVPLGTALDATLRPLGLDYVDAGGFLFIGTPETLARESFERVETRTYTVALDDTMPKIVLRNPAVTASGGIANGGASGGNFGRQGGFGGGGRNPGLGQGGFGGGQRGGRPQGGFGGGQQGGIQNQDVTAISNISDLFTTIDDRLVGETPAQIGLGISTSR